jgi:hypothetical protein
VTAPGEEAPHPHEVYPEAGPSESGISPEHPPEEVRAEPALASVPAAKAPIAEPAALEIPPAPPASPPPATEAEQAPAGAVNVPPPITVSERPAKPRRGWWGRLTQG